MKKEQVSEVKSFGEFTRIEGSGVLVETNLPSTGNSRSLCFHLSYVLGGPESVRWRLCCDSLPIVVIVVIVNDGIYYGF